MTVVCARRVGRVFGIQSLVVFKSSLQVSNRQIRQNRLSARLSVVRLFRLFWLGWWMRNFHCIAMQLLSMHLSCIYLFLCWHLKYFNQQQDHGQYDDQREWFDGRQWRNPISRILNFYNFTTRWHLLTNRVHDHDISWLEGGGFHCGQGDETFHIITWWY